MPIILYKLINIVCCVYYIENKYDNYPKYLLSMDATPQGNTEGILRKYIPDWLMESY
jgi:hypothetical protein